MDLLRRSIRSASSPALLAARHGASDAELIDTVGAPSFPTGCHVDGDVAELAAGRRTLVRCEAHIEQAERGELVIPACRRDRAHPTSRPTIESRVRSARSDALPIADLNDASFGSETRIIVRLADSADPDSVARQLRDMWGVHTNINVEPEHRCQPLYEHGSTDMVTLTSANSSCQSPKPLDNNTHSHDLHAVEATRERPKPCTR